MTAVAIQLYRRFLEVMSHSVEQLRRWFEDAVVENHRLFLSIAQQILRNGADAEDAVQSACCKAWSRLSELADADSLVGWVATIVRRTAIDVWRARRDQPTDEESLQAIAPAVNDAPVAEQADERARMQGLIAELPDTQATVLTLRFYEGLDAPAIGKRLGLTDNAVRVRMHRGLERLAQLMESHEEGR